MGFLRRNGPGTVVSTEEALLLGPWLLLKLWMKVKMGPGPGRAKIPPKIRVI